jgi:LysM repeat protein
VQPSRPAIASGVPGIDISGEKIVSGGKTYYMHEVQKGQTLYSIARAYRVTILDIDRENSIPPGGIQTGQVLKIPASLAFEVIEEQTPPADAAATPVRGTATATNAPRGNTAADAKIPGQATARQQTRMPFQEQPAARSDTEKPVVDDDMTVKTTEVKENADVKTQTAAQAQPEPEMQQHAQPEAETRQQAQQQTPSTGKSNDQPKPVQPERRKVHKVQRGESLADIAKKYNITVQELKKANKGVIFAMPDMRLVIPPSKEE